MSDDYGWLDPTKELIKRDPGSLSYREIHILQDELRRYREFYAKSQRYGVQFVLDEMHVMHPDRDKILDFHKDRAGAQLGVNIAADRHWSCEPSERPFMDSTYRLEVVVWPDNFFNPKRPGE